MYWLTANYVRAGYIPLYPVIWTAYFWRAARILRVISSTIAESAGAEAGAGAGAGSEPGTRHLQFGVPLLEHLEQPG